MWDLGVEFYELLIHGPTQAPPTSSIQRRSLHSWLRYYDSVVHKMSPSVPWLVTRSVEALSALTTGQPSAFLFSPQLPLAFHFPLLFSELPVLWLIYPLSSCFIDATPPFASWVVTIWERVWTLSLDCHCDWWFCKPSQSSWYFDLQTFFLPGSSQFEGYLFAHFSLKYSFYWWGKLRILIVKVL